MDLVRSTRAWRKGLRAFILTDDKSSLEQLAAAGREHGESYGYFPSDGDELLRGLRHGTKLGDTRAAVAPFAAHRHFGKSYKWMLYGDDDTLFYMPAVRKLLAQYPDPSVPLAFSDNLWYGGKHPNPHAPRCLPCHMKEAARKGDLPTLQQIMNTPAVMENLRKYLVEKYPGVRVTDAMLRDFANNSTQIPGRKFVPKPACPYCTPQAACPPGTTVDRDCLPSVPHGGAGMIISRGMLEAIPFQSALECILSHSKASGSDYLVTVCLWRAGFGITDPGPLVQHLYDPHYHTFGGLRGMGYLWDPMGHLTHAKCNATCRWMLYNTLTLHVQGRHFRNWKVSSMQVYGVTRASEAATAYLDAVHDITPQERQHLPWGSDENTAGTHVSAGGNGDDDGAADGVGGGVGGAARSKKLQTQRRTRGTRGRRRGS